MKVLQVIATVLIINAIPEYDIHIYWQYCRTRKGITFLPFSRREPFIPYYSVRIRDRIGTQYVPFVCRTWRLN